MEREITIALLDEIQDGFVRHDVDAILSHFTEDCIWLMARPDVPEGRRCIAQAGNRRGSEGALCRTSRTCAEEMRHRIVDQNWGVDPGMVWCAVTPKVARLSNIPAATLGVSRGYVVKKTPTGVG